jgi:hypothetical protein
MLVVAQEHGVDGSDLIRGQRGISGFFESHMRQYVLAGTIERGICQKAEAIQFYKGCRASNQGNRGCGHDLSFASRAIVA